MSESVKSNYIYVLSLTLFSANQVKEVARNIEFSVDYNSLYIHGPIQNNVLWNILFYKIILQLNYLINVMMIVTTI